MRSAPLDAWLGHEMPRHPGFAKTGGGWGHLAWRTGTRQPDAVQWTPAAYGAMRESKWKERDRDSGSFVNNPKFKTQFCNFNFSPSSWLQMKKKINIIFVQFFEIYNFRLMHFFV